MHTNYRRNVALKVVVFWVPGDLSIAAGNSADGMRPLTVVMVAVFVSQAVQEALEAGQQEVSAFTGSSVGDPTYK